MHQQQSLSSKSSSASNPQYQAPQIDSSHTFAGMSRDFFEAIQKPLGLIALIPLVAGAGALTAYTFTSIAPLAGAIILGNFASIAVYTSFACKLLGLNDNQTIVASLVTSLFLTMICSVAAFSYLRMPPIPMLKIALLTVGTGIELAITYAFIKNIAAPT